MCDSYYHSGGNTTSRMPVAACHKPKLGGEGHFSFKSWNMAVREPLACQAERTAINKLPLHIVTALSNTKADCSARRLQMSQEKECLLWPAESWSLGIRRQDSQVQSMECKV